MTALVVWGVLFGLFATKTKLAKIAAITAIAGIVMVASMPHSIKLYYRWSKHAFMVKSNGSVNLTASPFRVRSKNPEKYCNRFTKKDGSPIKTISYVKNRRIYCGYFPGIEESDNIYVIYRFLPHNKAEYWSSPSLQIIGPRPK